MVVKRQINEIAEIKQILAENPELESRLNPFMRRLLGAILGLKGTKPHIGQPEASLNKLRRSLGRLKNKKEKLRDCDDRFT